MNEPLLELQDISFDYAGNANIFSHLSFEIRSGERLAILGRNGVGKTTLLHLLMGLKKISSGKILMATEPLGYQRKQLMRWRQEISIVFQNPDDQVFAPTVEQDVSFGPTNLGLDSREIEHRVTNSLRAMGLEDYRARTPLYLSGGEKKRVAIAGALAMNPRILLLDEPSSSLDDESRFLLERSLNHLSGSGTTIVASTHDLDFAWRWADRVIVLLNGGIAADAPARDVLMDRPLLESARLQRPLLAELAAMLPDKKMLSRQTPDWAESWRNFEQRIYKRC